VLLCSGTNPTCNKSCMQLQENTLQSVPEPVEEDLLSPCCVDAACVHVKQQTKCSIFTKLGAAVTTKPNNATNNHVTTTVVIHNHAISTPQQASDKDAVYG
jgi:hypothetical protein